MTTPTNWPNPERPGYPMFPERDGWHVLQFLGLTEACRWRPLERPKEWITTVGMGFTRAELAREGVVYIGPVLTPTQIDELLAGERERIKSMVRRACNLGNIITPRQRDMIIAGVDSETAIRNLGDAP